ncbi:MAG: hypothetical protein ACYS9X_07120 [Planctomycetota bacterium]
MTRGGSDDASRDPAAAAATLLAAGLFAVPWLLTTELTPAEFVALRDSGARSDAEGRYFRLSGVIEERRGGGWVIVRDAEGEATASVAISDAAPLPGKGEAATFHGRLGEVDMCGCGSGFVFVLDAREGWLGGAAAAGLVVAAGTLAMFAWTLVTWLRASRK